MATEPVKGSEELAGRYHPLLLGLIAKTLDISPSDLIDLELQLIDTQRPALGGACDELLFSGRLDNLCSGYQILRALIDASVDTSTAENVQMSILFDHEEVGSNSACGAGSSIFMDTLRSINSQLCGSNDTPALMRTLRQSLVVSADMAHALHPNYTAKHDHSMAPKINQGCVIKHNANQRYATTVISATMFREFAKLANIPCQEFAIRADGACGSTIGPVMSALSGILTVDVGTPQYSMHSIREMMGSEDAYLGYAHYKSALENHPKLAKKMQSLDT